MSPMLARFLCCLLCVWAGWAGAADPRLSDPAQLGKALMPLGGERAGNADGSIPAWDGGLTKPPPGYRPGEHYPDPFAADPVLYTVTGENAERYREHLSPGQLAMLKQYPTYRMQVYPARRSAAAPARIYAETRANPGRAKLVDEGNGVAGTASGIPFPIPKNGLEAIWNHILRYRGEAVSRVMGQAAVTAGGDYNLARYEDEFLFLYNHEGMTPEKLDNQIFLYRQEITAPARLAGRILVAQETLDAAREHRQVWVYDPGARRVRRAPEVAYDSPPPGTDGLRTVDQFDMFNGAPDLYDWLLVGKREMLVPYNAYRLTAKSVAPEKLLHKFHLNPELLRYELHRVWVVEARLKPGKRHIYARRTFYLDEDSWQALVVDQYDARGQIWRVSEAHPVVYFEAPALWAALELHHDLQSRRYLAFGMDNQDKPRDFSIRRTAADYTPEALRRSGVR